MFLCSLACESCSSKSGYSCLGWSRVGIQNSPVKSGHSHLIRDGWALCLGVFLGGGVRGHAPPEKNRNLKTSNCWKCVEIVNPTITALYLGHFKSFTVPSGGPFWLLGGGGGACAPLAPLLLPTGLKIHCQKQWKKNIFFVPCGLNFSLAPSFLCCSEPRTDRLLVILSQKRPKTNNFNCLSAVTDTGPTFASVHHVIDSGQ